MRTDGSVKTLVAGLTTLPRRRHNGTFLTEQTNMIADPARGLIRRSSTQYAFSIDIDDFDPREGCCVPFQMSGLRFWFIVKPHGVEDGIHIIKIVGDVLGTEWTVLTDYEDWYWNVMAGSGAISIVVFDDTAYICNSNIKVATTADLPFHTENSMVVIKQSPDVFSNISVTWKGSDNAVKSVVFEFETTDWETEDTGTNTTARAIAALMSAVATGGDEVYAHGSTILIKRSDDQYAEVVAEDGAGNTVAVAINDEVTTTADLPKYAPHLAKVAVRPDPASDTTAYYMQAHAVNSADPTTLFPTSAELLGTLTAGTEIRSGREYWGFSSDSWYDYGAIAPGAIGGALWHNFTLSRDATNPTQSTIWLHLDKGTPQPVDLFSYLHLVHAVSGQVVYSGQMQIWATNEWYAYLPTSNLITGDDYLFWNEIPDEAYGGVLPEVKWREATAPEQEYAINPRSMPRQLFLDLENQLFFLSVMSETAGKSRALAVREAGDDDTNPMPSFVGHRIADMTKFQNRLVMLSQNNVIMSATNKPYQFFRTTTSQLLGTDVIDIKSTSTDADQFNHAVSHNNDLLMFSSNAQFTISGSTPITPSNAALPQSSTYPSAVYGRPISVGDDVFFPQQYASEFLDTNTATISRYFVSQGAEARGTAETICAHIPRYINGLVDVMAGSSDIGVLMCTVTDSGKIYVCNYSGLGTNQPQMAWHEWTIRGIERIVGITIDNATARIIGKDYDQNIHQLNVPFYPVPTGVLPSETHLDWAVISGNTNTEIVIPWDRYLLSTTNTRVIQGSDCPNPYEQVEFTLDGRTMTLATDMEGGTVNIGQYYDSTMTLSNVLIQDDGGVSQSDAHLRITDWRVTLDAPNAQAYIVTPYYDYPAILRRSVTKNDQLNHELWRIPFKQPSDQARLQLESNLFYKMDLQQIEWRGTYIKKGRRF